MNGRKAESVSQRQQMLARAYSVMFNWWREQKQKRGEIWIADASHQCNTTERCTITTLLALIYEHSLQGKPEWHVCLEGCSRSALHAQGRRVLSISNVFICERTGKFHVCDSHCSEPTLRSPSAEHVCRMSGLLRGGEYHDTYTAPDDRGNCLMSASRKRKLVDLTSTTAGGGGGESGEEAWIKQLGLDVKNRNIAQQLVELLLFNQVRQQLENGRLRKLIEQSKNGVITYKRRCEKSGKLVSVMYAQWIYEDTMQRGRPPPYIELTHKLAARIVEYYAYFCMLLYAKLQKYVFSQQGEKEEPPSLKECVPAILYLMRGGLFGRAGAPLLSVDELLDYCLPEENTLDRFDIKKTQFTKVRNRIATGTAFAINARHLCTSQLSITPLSLPDILDVTADSITSLFSRANPSV